MKSGFLVLTALFLLSGASADEVPNAPIEMAPGVTVRRAFAVSQDATAGEVLGACRSMLPVRPVELTGSLIRRSRKGIVSSEHDYRLTMRRGVDVSLLTIRLSPRGETNELASVTISRKTGERPVIHMMKAGSSAEEVVASPLARVLDTDVTWLDLTFDFLWWSRAEYEAEREGESIHGQKCRVILVRPDVPVEGLSAVRLWVDRKTGCLMQAEQVGADGKPLRRLWGTRVKKFDGKWMVSVLEVETEGVRHRTKITVDGIREF